METSINKLTTIQNSLKYLSFILIAVGFSHLLNGCFFVQTAPPSICNDGVSYQGRVKASSFAYFNGKEWEATPSPLGIDNVIHYDIYEEIFADSSNGDFYFHTGFYKSVHKLWKFSSVTRQWKLFITANSSIGKFAVKDGIIYFYSNDSLYTDQGIVQGHGVMKYDGVNIIPLDTTIKISPRQMFIVGDWLYIFGDEIWRYSLSLRKYEKVPSSIFNPLLATKRDEHYEGVAHYIYYSYYDFYPDYKIFRYDIQTGLSTEIMPNFKTKSLPLYWCSEDFIFFKTAYLEYKGNTYFGNLIYNITKDEITTLSSGRDSTGNDIESISGVHCNGSSLYYGGSFYYSNGIKTSNIARYDVQEHKTYSLDGGVYKVYPNPDCEREGVRGIARSGDKLLVFGNFESAGIR